MKRVSHLCAGLVVACATPAVFAQAVPWSDNFDSYADNDTLISVSDWEEWDENNAATKTKVRDGSILGIATHSGSNAIWVRGSSDTIYQFNGTGPGGQGPYTSGAWSLSAQTYLPVNSSNYSMDIESWFIMTNKYSHNAPSGGVNWSVQVRFNPLTAMWAADLDTGGYTGAATLDQWTEMRADIDLDADLVELFYGGVSMGAPYQWNGGVSGPGTGDTAIGNLDLFADGQSSVGSRMFYDTVALTSGPAGCSSNPVAYCTAGTSTNGCTPTMSSTGTASASATSGFMVTASGLEGAKDGLFFYGQNGRQATTWGNGSSFQCVVTPVKRGGLQTGIGTPNVCDGSYTQDLNARWCLSCSNPNHNPTAGVKMQIQCWYRDPFNTSNQTTSLSNALEVDICP